MDFMKLFNLCRTSTLYFPSADMLRDRDPFEGSHTLYHSKCQFYGEASGDQFRELGVTERHTPPSDWDEADWRFFEEVNLNMRKKVGKYMFVNSWHKNQNESLAMWKLYYPSGYGIAVVSSFDRLRESLSANDETIYIGCITYIDYGKEEKWLGNLFDPFMHKHKAFAHEQEIRAVVQNKGYFSHFARMHHKIAAKYERHKYELRSTPPSARPRPGMRLKCDLDRLIDYVVVSPTSPKWVFQEIREYCNGTVRKKVSMSELKSGPFF
jgi:hypothetical protein